MSQAIDVLGIGLNATDTVLLVNSFPPYAGKVPFEQELLSPGGQIATAMVACARLGLRAKYVGTVGSDERGRIQQESLANTGVDTSGVIVRTDCPNQTAYIIVDTSTGERTVLWQRPSCLRLSSSEISEEDIRSARLLHIDGYDTEAAAHAASLAQQHRIPVSLDVDTVYPDFEAVLCNVDYLVASSNWTREWTGDADPMRALPRLAREFDLQISAMTLGDHGSLAFAAGQWHYSPAFEVTCIDTTGAGDLFHGAFCYAMLCGMTLQAALDFSNAAAALNCTAFGARGHVPFKVEVDALLADSSAGRIRRRGSPEIEERVAAANQMASAQPR